MKKYVWLLSMSIVKDVHIKYLITCPQHVSDFPSLYHHLHLFIYQLGDFVSKY